MITDEAAAVPVSPTWTDESWELTVRLPDNVPATVGLYVTVTEQFAPAANTEPQVLVWVTFEGSTKLRDVVAPVPELLSVKELDADWPATTLPKTSESGLAPSVV